MAVRNISTRLAIEGEAEYKASLTRINSELKSLQSALKLTESEFKGQSNSIEALKSKGESLNKLHEQQTRKVTELQKALENAQKAVSVYSQKKAELTKKIAENEKALDELKSATGDTTEEQAKLTAENAKLNAELSQNDKYLDAAEKGVNGWETQLNSAQIELNDLNGEIKENDKYLDEARKSSDGCATSIDEFGDKVKKTSEASTDLKNALAASGLIAALKAVAEAIEACVKDSIEFESAMAGVKKTTDMSGDELDAMGNAIQELSTRIPATAVEIANVTEAAGQLGIAKEDLLSFSEVMVNLGVATNLSSTEAASALAKFANVVGMSADNYENLGSVIVALGNNFATTESDIVAMATRLSSTGNLVGLSESEIMAVATALSSLGIEAEAGGSAISKLLKKFETMVATGSPKLEDFAAVAGMSAEEFSKAWGDDAIGALSLFVDGLGDVDAAGGSSIAVLEDLGITELRMSNAVLALASSEGILNDAVDLANVAWNENTALAIEAETRYGTTESKLQMLSNSFTNVKIAIGDQLTPALGELATAGSGLLDWLADVIEQNEWLVPTIGAVVTALAIFAGAVTITAIATTAFGGALKAAALAMATNPIFLAVAAIGALAVAIGLAAANANAAKTSVNDLTTAAQACDTAFTDANAAYKDTADYYSSNADLARAYVTKLKELEEQGLKTTEAQSEYALTVDLLKGLIPTLNVEIDKQTGCIAGGTDAILAQIDAWESLGLAQAMQEKYQAELKAYNAVLAEQYSNRAKLIQAETEGNLLKKEQNKLQEEARSLGAQMIAVYEDTTLSAREQGEAYWELQGKQFEVDMQIRALSGDMRENEELQGTLTEAVEKGAEAVEEYRGPLDEARAATELYAQEQAAAADATGQSTSAAEAAATAQGEITQRLNDLAAAYKDAKDAAQSSIDGQIGLFGDFTAKLSEDTDTVGEMLTRWGEQTESLSKYTENLQKAAEYGLDKGLIQSLSDGSAESAAYLSTIISEVERLGGTTEGLSTNAQSFVDKFNAAFSGVQTAKDEWSTTVATMETELTDSITAIETAASEADFSGLATAIDTAFANVGVDFKSIGLDVGSGLATGIDENKGKATAAAADMGSGVEDAAREALDSHSDSRVMIALGGDVVGGLVTGIEQNKGTLITTVQTLGNDVVRISEDSARDLVNRYIQEFSQITSRTQSEINTLKSVVTGALSSMPQQAASIGSQIVNGMIGGMNNRKSALYSTVRSIVNSAISAAKSAAATASPSKKTTKIFEDVGEGMVVGLENKRKKVSYTAQDVVDDALSMDTTKTGSDFSKSMQSVIDSVLMLDANRIDDVIQSINDRVPDLSAPERSRTESSAKTMISFGDINVEVTVQSADKEQAASVGMTIGEEITRQLRYRGVMT